MKRAGDSAGYSRSRNRPSTQSQSPARIPSGEGL